jgi:hypothetical protein
MLSYGATRVIGMRVSVMAWKEEYRHAVLKRAHSSDQKKKGDIIGQDLLVLIIRAYLRRPDQIEACEKIFKLIMLYYGIGRAGEIAFSSWNHARLVSNIFTSVCWFDDT